VGLDNFSRLWLDPIFWKSVQVTLLFNLIVNPLQTILALALALLLNQRVRCINIFRGIFLIPVAISINVSSVIWKLMLDQNGLINGLLATMHLARQPFFLSVDQALWSIIWIASWIGVPFWSLFILAGLQNIPQHVYEAAEIDGAAKRQQFWQITLPLLRNSLTFVLIAATVANFLLFVPVLLLTRGGPELTTNVAMYEAYRRGLIYGDLGASSAMVTMLLVIIILVVGGQSYLLREK
jgi:multiple sugar transport system permease protein